MLKINNSRNQGYLNIPKDLLEISTVPKYPENRNEGKTWNQLVSRRTNVASPTIDKILQEILKKLNRIMGERIYKQKIAHTEQSLKPTMANQLRIVKWNDNELLPHEQDL